jgi:flagellar motor switch protein FliN/FliY
MQLLPLFFAKDLIDELINPKQEAATAEAVREIHQPPPVRNDAHVQYNDIQHEMNQMEQQVYQQPMHHQQVNYSQEYMEQPGQQMYAAHQPQYTQPRQQQPPVNVRPADFTSFEPMQYHQQEIQNLDMLLDIPLQVTVELGRTKRSVKEILELSSGSIIELDKLAGEPVDILVNSKIVAKGEVVVIDENFGVRVTDIISQTERLNKLK